MRARGWMDGGRCVAALLAVAVVLPVSSPAWAGTPTDQLKASVDKVLRILEDPSAKSPDKTMERRASIRSEVDNIFDFQETAKRALGAHWQSLGPKEQEEFVALFADLLERSYLSKIERYSGERITYAGDAVDGDVATVKTRFTTKQGTEFPIDYRMLRRGDRWLTYDVLIEGVSLVANYRVQFAKIIQASSYADLVARMRNGESELNTSGGVKRKDTPRS